MGNQLFGGRRGDLADSLAEYIENAFNSVRAEYGFGPMPDAGKDDRTMLFLGIARGIVEYLDDFSEAFVIESHTTGGATDPSRHSTTDDGHVQIQVRS